MGESLRKTVEEYTYWSRPVSETSLRNIYRKISVTRSLFDGSGPFATVVFGVCQLQNPAEPSPTLVHFAGIGVVLQAAQTDEFDRMRTML